MTRKSNVYLVTHQTSPTTTDLRLVRAKSPLLAERHVASGTISAALATQDQIFEIAKGGGKIEEADSDPDSGKLPGID